MTIDLERFTGQVHGVVAPPPGLEMRVLAKPWESPKRRFRISTHMNHFTDLQPPEQSVLPLATESPAVPSLSGTEQSPEQEQIAWTHTLVRQMTLRRTNLT